MNRRELITGAGAIAAASVLPAAPVYPMSVGLTRDFIDTFQIGDVRRMVFEDPLTLHRYRVPMRCTGIRQLPDRRWQFSFKSCGPRVEVSKYSPVWIPDIRKTSLWVPR